MVGTKNGAFQGRGYTLETDMTAAQAVMAANSTYTGILNSNGTPEGSLSANPGSIAQDRTNGDLYKKESGTGNTGWVRIVSSVVQEVDGGTGQSTYTTGDILYASATNTLSKLAAGSDGEVLTLASGVPSWAAGGGGGGTWTLLDQYALTGGETNVDFTDLSANEYMYFANAVQPSVSASLRLLLSTDNGSTFETSYVAIRYNGSMTINTSQYDSTITTGNFHWMIGSVNLTALGTTPMGVLHRASLTSEGSVHYGFGNFGGPVDAMRFAFSAGTFNNAGVISVWGR